MSDLTNAIATAGEHKLYEEKDLRKVVNGEIINYTQYKLFIGEFEGSDLSELFNILQQSSKNDECHVFIQSPGGCSNEGIALSDFLYSRFPDLTTEILNQASSMGSLIFCIGKKRIVNRNSRNMLHNYSTGYNQMKASDVKVRVDFFDSFLSKYLSDMYLKTNFLTKSEFKQMIDGKEFWFDADEMLKRNIATHIRTPSGVKTRN